ncbi:GNAT family acetyltransferase [Streptococcus gallolyticus subsp. gallolyticus]|uniref:GNAT family N-acetyltransferase n=1 Tax=Streptococcus gallolyticus TaxID=315405 RepID=UPI000201B4B8|nr:GNAT family N-acetyltransferase [Streptococcus gallolyticus]MCY7178848.1 GNAT family N-acetyltransferase [Streptococcus gallolyticus subsp. gallolyticus]MCY7193495.1 GNAT family N-acetyltransferase [Streptococcus gallolyticus subsp. gallolyticus]MCY7201954.1 GNAT family N-acetyltransferase [Streptococcus gallolyticus subsp. gallolyticus]OAV81213.1 GNAT family acetyltransferase [Streptococcus gallolyticus subsp. gallolyticus]OCW48754.1 GNAT family acetyltransferase [Streptococcus gallolyticu
MKLKEIIDDTEKQDITHFILGALPEWFGISEARKNYIKESAKCPFIAAYDKKHPLGFVYLKETGRDTVELFVMGVLKEYHRQGVGKALVLKAKEIATKKGYTFLQVKTVQMGKYDSYDSTNHFYLSLGFKEFEVFPTLWDDCNPCQIYVMALE